MRKFFIALAIIVGMLVASVFMAAAPSQASAHVPGKVCVSAKVYNHIHSTTARQCKRQGFLYERGSWPVDITTTPWTMQRYVLVYGPNGNIRVNIGADFLGIPNVR